MHSLTVSLEVLVVFCVLIHVLLICYVSCSVVIFAITCMTRDCYKLTSIFRLIWRRFCVSWTLSSLNNCRRCCKKQFTYVFVEVYCAVTRFDFPRLWVVLYRSPKLCSLILSEKWLQRLVYYVSYILSNYVFGMYAVSHMAKATESYVETFCAS